MSEDVKCLNGHTIMLVQFSANEETRTYVDCKTPNDALETFCRVYENFLLHKNGLLTTDESNKDDTNKKIEYQLEDILKFID